MRATRLCTALPVSLVLFAEASAHAGGMLFAGVPQPFRVEYRRVTVTSVDQIAKARAEQAFGLEAGAAISG